MDRQLIKENGKAAFKANYWKSVCISFILTFVTVGLGSIGGSRINFDNSTDETENVHNAMNVFSASAASPQNASDEITEILNDPQSMALTAGILVFILIVILIACLVGFVLKVLVYNPIRVGCYSFFKNNYTSKEASLDDVLDGFEKYDHTLLTMLLKDVFLFLWALLFIIPGIVKAYSYRMVPYLIKDNPDMSPKDIITQSRNMMDGHKWEVFVFDLSFIGWYILGAFTFGLLNIFWTNPYKENASAGIYLKLKDRRAAGLI